MLGSFDLLQNGCRNIQLPNNVLFYPHKGLRFQWREVTNFTRGQQLIIEGLEVGVREGGLKKEFF